MSRLLARVSTSRVPVIASSPLRLVVMRSGSGEAGSGAGRGGGGGGVIREAGGAFGKMEAAHEEQYFRKLQAEQMKKLKQHLDEEIEFHKAEIKRHEEAISRHKSKKKDLDV